MTLFRSMAAVVLALGATFATPSLAQKKYDTGANDTEITVGQTIPLSGPASAYGAIGKVQAAYIRMINEQGGVNGRKINLIQYDDAYSPPKTVENVRKLVEEDEVLTTFQIIGTPPNAAVQKYLNQKKVPQLLAATGATRFNDPKNFPWTIAFNPNYQSEGHIYAKYILANHPNAKIGILYQNDDLGKDYVKGLKDGLGAKASSMIVAEVSYELSDPTVDSQMVTLQSSGADLFYNITTPKFGAQAIRKAAQLGWKPVHILDINATPVSQTLVPAGLENAKGIISVNYGKDPLDPQWANDEGMKRYKAFMSEYAPGEDANSGIATYGYSTTALFVQILKQCGDDLTRANIMEGLAMAVNMIVRRKGDYQDDRLRPLRNEGIALLKKHGALSHRFGFYHSGAQAGQIFIAIGYPDLATHERAMQGMSQDADWKRVAGEIEKIAPLQETYLTVTTEDQ
jgi:branched-chain amino acid transport system substrate-binding protein